MTDLLLSHFFSAQEHAGVDGECLIVQIIITNSPEEAIRIAHSLKFNNNRPVKLDPLLVDLDRSGAT
jgi:hypothetical protein